MLLDRCKGRNQEYLSSVNFKMKISSHFVFKSNASNLQCRLLQ